MQKLLFALSLFKDRQYHNNNNNNNNNNNKDNGGIVCQWSMCVYVCVHAHMLRCPVISDSLQTHGFLCPWDFPGKNSGVGCHFLLQGIFPTQRLNPSLLCLLDCRQILYLWATGETLNEVWMLINICLTLGTRYQVPKCWGLHSSFKSWKKILFYHLLLFKPKSLSVKIMKNNQ